MAWILAMRPKTLTGAAAPVLLGMAMAWKDMSMEGMSSRFSITALILALLFAFFMQIDANLVNDFYDYIKGRDGEQRLGPERACAQGWVTLEAMKRAIAGCTVMSCIVGLPLVIYGGLEMIAVGIACVLCCFLYTTHLAGKALGDVLVVVFFGIVPVCICYYLQLHTVPLPVFAMSVAMGLYTDRLLIVNNYRDIDIDIQSSKRTLAVILGRRATRYLYTLCSLIAFIIAITVIGTCYHDGSTYDAGLIVPAIVLAASSLYTLRINSSTIGRELNKTLATTALSIFIFALTLSIIIIS